MSDDRKRLRQERAKLLKDVDRWQAAIAERKASIEAMEGHIREALRMVCEIEMELGEGKKGTADERG